MLIIGMGMGLVLASIMYKLLRSKRRTTAAPARYYVIAPEPTRNYVPALPETRKRGALPMKRSR